MRRRGFQRGRRGTSRPIRNREWFAFTTAASGTSYDLPRTQIITAGQAFKAWIMTPGQTLTFYDEPTVVRMLLYPQLYLAATSAQAAADYRITVRGGIIPWKGGTINLSTPTSLDGLDPDDATLDWMWWFEAHFNHYNLTYLGTSNYDFTGNSGVVEVKSKRKLELGFGLAGAWTCLADSTPAGVGANIHMAGRILVLNH
jgi:hypothetical protein